MTRKVPLRRKTPLRRGTSQLKRSPLRAVSKKRQKENRQYTKLRAEYLEEHPVCEICDSQRADQIHHRARRGSNFLNADTFLALCANCHHTIETNGRWAREMGYIISL